LHQVLVLKADKFFNEQAGRGYYNVQELTEVRIPVNLPGIADWKGYENISGQLRLGDACYNYVKMKMTRTAMYLMCVPNYESTRLSGQNIIEAKAVRHLPVPKKDHVPFGKSIIADSFNFAFVKFNFTSPLKIRLIRIALPVQKHIVPTRDIPEQPPKSFC